MGDGTLAYDSRLQEYVSFGGVIGCGYTNYVGGNTWTFSNGSWTNRSAALSAAPAPRYGMAMAYDAADGYVVAFGGNSGSGTVFGDTWTFNGTWTNVTGNQTTSPLPSWNLGVAYDNATRSVILVGGFLGNYSNQNATWAFQGGQWTAVPAATLPPPLRAPGLLYDPTISSLLLYGGMGNLGPLNETWTFANGTWTQLFPASTPPALWDTAAFFDGGSGLPIVFGGYTGYVGSYYPARGTWGYIAGSWTNISASVSGSPSLRGAARVAWDPNTNSTLLFGGRGSGAAGLLLNDTWVYSSLPLTSATLTAVPADVDLGHSLELETTPSGGESPYSFLYTELPPGCTTENFSSFACTPTAVGSFTIAVNVTDANGTRVAATSSLTVNPALTANLTTSPATLDLGQNVTFQGSASGGGGGNRYSFVGLPVGCRSVNDTVLTCRPTVAGTYAVTFEVNDSTGASALSVRENATVLGAVKVDLTVRSSRTLDLGQNLTLFANTTGGSGVYAVAYSGLPAGCASANLTLFRCVPSATGNFSISVQVMDSLGEASRSGPVNVSVFLPLRVAFSPSTLTMEVDRPANATANVTGGAAPLSYAWLDLPPSCVGVGPRVDCLPSGGGSFSLELQVGDAAGALVDAVALVNVVNALSVTLTASRTEADVGSVVLFTVNLTGGEAPVETSWGTGVGLNCTFSDLLAQCMPTQPGSGSVWFVASDGLGGQQNVSRSVLAAPALSLTISDAITASCSAPFDVVLTAHPAGGDPAYSYAWAFGDGSNATVGPVTGHEYGVAGTFTVALKVDDEGGGQATQSLTVVVASNATLCPVRSNNATNVSSGSTGNWFSGSAVWIALVVGLVIIVAILALKLRGRGPASDTDPTNSSTDPPSEDPGWNVDPPTGETRGLLGSLGYAATI
ncbi:MAG: PKD domain-containing protein [Thermoplasmata archaeon]|nr:PKD domain-containing protein [Thermoplasmata archaeon]